MEGPNILMQSLGGRFPEWVSEHQSCRHCPPDVPTTTSSFRLCKVEKLSHSYMGAESLAIFRISFLEQILSSL